MIKTLRITTIIAAFLAVGLLAFPVVYGYRGDEEIEKFLKSPGAIEKFTKAKGAKTKTGNQVSPLVKQALAFAEYLNPKTVARAPIKTTKPPVTPRQVADIKPTISSVKFKLIGTSYYASRPKLSLAYIDEPGKGLYWVRQGSNVAHLTIEEVKDGSIVVKDRERTITLAAERAPKKSLIKGETTSTSALPGVSASITSTSSVPVAAGAGQSVVSVGEKTTTTARPVDRRRPPQASNSGQDADAVLANFLNKLKAEQAGAGTGEGGSATLKEAIADYEAMRVPADEAKRLDRLGKELRNPTGGGGSKVGSRPPQSTPKPPPSSPRPPTRRPPSRPPK